MNTQSFELLVVSLVNGALMSISGNSSKLDVSSIDLTLMIIAGGRSRMYSQSEPCRNWWSLISSTPFLPSLSSTLHTRREMRDRALFDIGTSGGNIRFSFHVITLRYVSCAFSEQNGGYPGEFVIVIVIHQTIEKQVNLSLTTGGIRL